MGAKVIVDLANRYNAAFGFITPRVIAPPPVPGGQYLPHFGIANTYSRQQLSFEDIRFINTDKNIDLFFAGGALTKSGRLGNVFAPPPIISWHKNKNLIITPIDGTDSEVVERYGDGNWDMTFQGLIVDMENHEFPFYKIEQFRKMFEVPDYFEVNGQIFEAKGVESIFFTEIDATGVQGYEDTFSYTLKARSIKPLEFYINGEN